MMFVERGSFWEEEEGGCVVNKAETTRSPTWFPRPDPFTAFIWKRQPDAQGLKTETLIKADLRHTRADV